MDILKWIQNWYLENCDGDWEHCHGIKIYTLDNPGWSVNIDLTDTYLEFSKFELIQKCIDDNDWIHCNVADGVFKGGGSVDKLEEILRIFSEWATANNESTTTD